MTSYFRFEFCYRAKFNNNYYLIFLVGNGDDFTIVEGFGSFLMDMFSAGSDLDLSINFGNYEVEVSRAKRIQTLRKFEKKLKALQSNSLNIWYVYLFFYDHVSNLKNL